MNQISFASPFSFPTAFPMHIIMIIMLSTISIRMRFVGNDNDNWRVKYNAKYAICQDIDRQMIDLCIMHSILMLTGKLHASIGFFINKCFKLIIKMIKCVRWPMTNWTLTLFVIDIGANEPFGEKLIPCIYKSETERERERDLESNSCFSEINIHKLRAEVNTLYTQ